MEEEVLSLKQLATGYGKGKNRKLVGSGLCGSLRAGTLTLLVGRNGCGKSTLLRTLAGFLPPDDGVCAWQGQRVETFSKKQLAKMLSIVLTARPDTSYLTVREIVSLGRLPYTAFMGQLAKTDEEKVAAALETMSVAAFADRSLSSLSDGELQRVMLAKALAQETPVILLDEPTAFLDYPSKIEILRLLRSLAHNMGKTILLSTHDLPLALEVADRAWLLTQESIEERTQETFSEISEILLQSAAS